MGQTVRNNGPYDRLWMPGVPKDRDERTVRPKIEYLDDRRRAKAAGSAHQEALQYDFNFRKTAAAHGERPAKQHHLKESEPRIRLRTAEIGGRQKRTDEQRLPAKEQSPKRRQQVGQSAANAKSRPKNQRVQKRSAQESRNATRPQRETVTDFQTVRPNPQAVKQHALPKKSAAKKNRAAVSPAAQSRHEGHGRKLTPTYELKTTDNPRSKKHGAPVMEGGVMGFDMGTYGHEGVAAIPRRPVRARTVIASVLTIAVIFVLLTAVLAGQARLSNYTQQNANLERSISDLEEQISKLKMQIALQEDLGNLQERAESLGMSHPTDQQLQYVDLDSTDVTKVTPMLVLSESNTLAQPSFIENITMWFDSLWTTD